MYLPKAFDHPECASQIMRAHPLATLVHTGQDGWPSATAVPLHWDAQGGPHGTLWGHFARANPQGALLREQPQALAIFQGPHAYMSPSVYPDKERVPTWSYVMVQARVRVTMVDEPEAKDALLKRLIGDHEPAYAEQWKGLREAYTQDMLKRITAFQLVIEHIDVAVKLNQHRPEAHAAMAEQLAQGGESEQALHGWMVKLGMIQP